MTSKLLLILFLLFPASLLAADHKVSSAADIAAALPNTKPGDTLLLSDGTWTDQTILFKADGQPEKTITLRATTPGKVILTGKSSLKIDGQYLLVSGLYFKDGQGNGDAITLAGQHNRLTDCAITAGQYKFFVHLFGQNNRMDHCYLADKTSGDPTLQVEVDEKQPNHHQIDNNHFGHRPPLGRNGGETIRVGYSFQSMSSSATTVEHNLFDRCDGEIEIISSKSCDNIYRNNTFNNCAGFLTLRHGNRCTVDGNFFFGKGKKGSGGVRVIGEDHLITNNYIADVTDGVFRITSGIVDSELKGYFQAKRCTIAFNTIVNCKGAYLDLDAGINTSRRTLRPENITIANNIFHLPNEKEGVQLIKGAQGQGWKWMGNLASLFELDIDPPGIHCTDPKLQVARDGIYRPEPNSPALHSAQGDFPTIKLDIDGQPREGKYDIGCDQLSDAPITNRPLTPKDVGPSWSDGLQRTSPP
ncbi:MAG TPA: polysaccharide lyase 6 family protein [Tepidisphaeraceae bacterium]|jgi:poly(beta-D-mannuronate) lyase|nr:polysaccharide lyase 6 family protein [Tepidisphaeraceae bacterium]